MPASNKKLGSPESRCTHKEGFAAGLVALRAQGLEPPDFAKGLAADVIAGNITGARNGGHDPRALPKKHNVNERKRGNVKA